MSRLRLRRRLAALTGIAAISLAAPVHAQQGPCVNEMADIQDAHATKDQYRYGDGSLELLNLSMAGRLTAAGLADLIKRKPKLKEAVTKETHGTTPIGSVFLSCLTAGQGPCGIDVLEQLIGLGADVNKEGPAGVRPIDQLVYGDGFIFGNAELDQYQTPETLAGYCLPRQTSLPERLERLRWLIDQGARSGNINPLGQPIMMDAVKLGPDYMAEMKRAGATLGNSVELMRKEIDRLKASLASIEAAGGQ